MQTVFVLIKCKLGTTFDVAESLADTFDEVRSVHSVSGEHDLLARFDLGDGAEVGRFVTERIQTIPGVADTFSLVALNAFTG